MSKVIGHIRGGIHTLDTGMQLAIYDDEKEFWDYIMSNKSCDCECKVSRAHTKILRNITPSFTEEQLFRFEIDLHEHLRPRFWYVALAKCVPGGDSYHPSITRITENEFRKYFFTAWYNIEMTQGNGDQFPVYQKGLLEVYTVLMFFSIGLVLLQTYAVKLMKESESFHPIMKLLTIIVSLFCVNNVLMSIHFFLFNVNGIGLPLFRCIARIIEVFNRVSMILLAMLIAKGWTINTVKLEDQDKLSFVMALLLTLYLSLAMWYLVWLDPASTLYLYDSLPGFCICILQFAVMIWFTWTIQKTQRNEDTSIKRQFFRNMMLMFNLYLISLPIIVSIASILSPWVREKIVDSVMLCVDFFIYTTLVYLLWPTRAPRYFERLYSVCTQSEKATLRDSQEVPMPSEEL